MSNSTLDHLKQLVSFDTQNPPRDIHSESEIFTYLKSNLTGFRFQMVDSGEGCISLLAIRGNPDLLFNFHIDTVPVAKTWNSDPFSLIITETTAIGLGACDIKGASACMLSAVAKTTGDVALLFSSDEEHGSSKAVKAFLTSDHGFSRVIVSEPTMAEAVLAHRGIQSATIQFSGISGHASEKRALTDSAIHRSGRWISAALSWVEQQHEQFDTLSGLPFNIGKIEGGIKANMIAADCSLAFGFRPLPGQNASLLLEELKLLALETNQICSTDVSLQAGFFGPTLPSATRFLTEQEFENALIAARNLATQCNLSIGNAVNFWTEASLFSDAGIPAIVFGPGDIAQAHTVDEWVELSQLQRVEDHYLHIIQNN